MKNLLITLALAFAVSGCADVSTRVAPKIDLSHYRHLYVQHLLTDGRGTDELISRELRHLGYDAVAGPRQLMPKDTELVIIYQDVWNFDFTNYMFELSAEVHTAHTDKLLAEAHVRKPSITGNSSLDMVDSLLKGLFKRVGPAVPDPAPYPGPESTAPTS